MEIERRQTKDEELGKLQIEQPPGITHEYMQCKDEQDYQEELRFLNFMNPKSALIPKYS
jgi:hypothetical protein